MVDRAPTTLLVFGLCAMLLILAMAWTALPWRAALMVTAAMSAGFETGKIGARWHDERYEDDNDA